MLRFPPGSSQKGIAHLFLVILLVAGIGLGLYLVQNKTNLLPFASNELKTPETSFQLEANKPSVKAGEEFKINVLVRSDFDAANTFSALINYPSDKLEVVKIEPSPESSQSAFIEEPLKKRESLVSKFFDSFSSIAGAQSPMPTLMGASVCLGDTPRVALSWNSDLNPDVLNWDIYREPAFVGFPGAYVGNYAMPFSTPKVGRLEYPLLAQGDAGGTYTYYLGGASGQSNKVTVTNNATCANNSQLVEAIVPSQVQPGAQFNVKYTFKNIGTRTWPTPFSTFGNEPKVELKMTSNSSFTPSVKELKKTVGGINLSVYPNQTYTFEFPVTAPSNAGVYDFNWQLAYSGTAFGETSSKKITVGVPASPSPSLAPSIKPSVSPSPVVSASPSATPVNLVFFIKKWIEQTDNKKGLITLSGAVPNPGYKTPTGSKALMATITFRAKAGGQANIDFNRDGTAIYRNSDNQNILTVTRGTTIAIGGGSPTPTPLPTYPGKIYLKPEAQQVSQGCVLPVTVAFSTGGLGVDGVDAILLYNPKVVTLSSYEKGKDFEEHIISVNNASGKVAISGIAPVKQPFTGAGVLAMLNFSVNPGIATGTKFDLSFDYDPNKPDKTTDSNMVESVYIRDILGSVVNGTYTVGGGTVCVKPSPTPSTTLKGKRADLFKSPNKPDFIDDQDISVFFSKCAEKGVELFGQPASVQPVCDIFEDGKITVSDWAVLVKFRNQSVSEETN
jgi:hypothetical protein